jgi:hypothetical protein
MEIKRKGASSSLTPNLNDHSNHPDYLSKKSERAYPVNAKLFVKEQIFNNSFGGPSQ